MLPPLNVAVVGRALLSKSDGSPAECEDSISIDLARGTFAVADGATEGFDSRRWSRFLTRAWVSPSSAALQPYDLPDCVRTLGQRLQQRWQGRRLPWYLEEKANSGAFAAFIGLQLTESRTWSAVALGDACLLIERAGNIDRAFPISSANDFTNRPTLVASKGSGADTKQAMRVDQGVCLVGDVFLLMSDAIACWYLSQDTGDRSLRDEFHEALPNAEHFRRFVTRERELRRLRDDDVAVLKLVLNVSGGDGNY